MNLEGRVENLESLLLPKPDYLPDLYDAIIEMDMATACLSRDEAKTKYGDKDTWCNDRRDD